MRQVSLEGGYNHFLVSNCMIDNRTFVSSKGTTQQAPLYIYNDTENEQTQRQPNINQSIFKALSEAYSKEPTPEEILYYIYSVLYSNTYREKYSEFLRIDFPRVPFTSDHDLFLQMTGYGKRLVDLHLLESEELDQPVAKFQGDGDGVVEKPKYDDANGRVYINKDEYFEGVSKDVWNYYIGGYQVCDKWLKDRRKRGLSLEEMKHYCRMVTAIGKTIEIQGLIDDVYLEAEKDVIRFKTL